MTSGKGPAVVRYGMLMKEQDGYNFNLGNGNFFQAALKLRGIFGLLPEDYGIKKPEIPDELINLIGTKPSIDQERKIRKWFIEQQDKAYEGIQEFIKQEYNNLQGSI